MKKLFTILGLFVALSASAQNIKELGSTGGIMWMKGKWYFPTHPSLTANDTLHVVDLKMLKDSAAALRVLINSISGGGSSYTLPTASSTVLGGIKIGSGLSIDGSGVVTASGGSTPTLQQVMTAGASSTVAMALNNNLILTKNGGPLLEFNDPTQSGSFTGILPAALGARIYGASGGTGLYMQGFGTGNVQGFVMMGHIGSNTPTIAPFEFYAFKKDGAAGKTSMAATEKAFSWVNGEVGDYLMHLYGNGLLQVDGMIQSLTGGIKFPDNTIQTTAASTSGYAGEDVTIITASYTVPTTNKIINIIFEGTATSQTITLPTGSSADKMVIYFRNNSANAITFSPSIWETSSTSGSVMSGPTTYKLIYKNADSKWYSIPLEVNN